MIHVLPDAELYSLLDFLPPEQRGFLQGKEVRTSFIQHLPFARTRYRAYLPLCPLAIEGLDVSGYDLVVSSSYVVAKGVLTTADQLHVSYIHSPFRYAWDLHFQYLSGGGYERGIKRMLARLVFHYLRQYDAVSASRPDVMVANSRYVAGRIWKTYRRQAQVVHPPVDVEAFPLYPRKEDYYVTVSRLVSYKRIDLLVEAFNAMPERELLVIGDGPEMKRLQALAQPNVRILGHQPQEALIYYVQRARAFMFAAVEDFGIAPVEAQASGTPVIAYGRGGALETVEPGRSGLLFYEQHPEAVRQAVRQFERERSCFEPELISEHAKQFSVERFRAGFAEVLDLAWDQFEEGLGLKASRGSNVFTLNASSAGGRG